jgi:RNA polymerase sigma factor (sigma-70 family)
VLNEDFADLLARARSGDRDAIYKLIKEYEPHVRRVAHRRVSPRLRALFDTMDMVQSINRSFMLGLKQNKFPITSPEHLIRLVVVMLKRKVSRRQKRRDDEIEVHQQYVELTPRTPENPAEKAEREDLLRQIMNWLNERGRRLLELFLQKYSLAESAVILECDPNSFRVEWSRLRKNIRAKFHVDLLVTE